MNSLAKTNGPTAASGGTGSATGAASGLSGLTGPKLLVAETSKEEGHKCRRTYRIGNR